MRFEQGYQVARKRRRETGRGCKTDAGTPQLLDICDKTRNARIIDGVGIISVVMSKAVS